ncbi:hypothetical protein C7N43_26030 [Sphingobacteriales bacterium UPWRP_1]|nr:hypothetical protein BVG80_17835 [Sphingobacteriales bacterium TSM_CSM]PSJ74055.1 hypothetical protein C7N43_26030 [Sphingobacteriales bacterium UPWRP_1]
MKKFFLLLLVSLGLFSLLTLSGDLFAQTDTINNNTTTQSPPAESENSVDTSQNPDGDNNQNASGLKLWEIILIAISVLIVLFIALISFTPNRGENTMDSDVNPNEMTSSNFSFFNAVGLYDEQYKTYEWLYKTVFIQRITDANVIQFYNVLHFVINSLQQMDNEELVGNLREKAEVLKNYPDNPILAEFMRCKCKEHTAQTLKEYFSQKQDPLCDLYICIAKKATPQNELWYLYELIEASLNRIGLDTYFNQIESKTLTAPSLS